MNRKNVYSEYQAYLHRMTIKYDGVYGMDKEIKAAFLDFFANCVLAADKTTH